MAARRRATSTSSTVELRRRATTSSTPTRCRSASAPCEVARHRVPDQRRAVLLHRLRQARGQPGPRQGPRRRLPGARLRADGLDRRELLPHVALPLRRGGPRLRRPARHRRHRRDRRGRAEHRPGRRHLRRRELPDVLRGDHQRRHAARPTRRRSASWSPATRTTRASSCGASPTSRSPTPRARATTSSRSFALTRELDPTRPVGFVNVMLAPHGKCLVEPVRRRRHAQPLLRLVRGHGRPRRPPSARWRPSSRRGQATASRSSSPSTARTPWPACTPSSRSRGPRSTRSTSSTCTTASSTASTPSSASRCGTSPTSQTKPGVVRVDGNKKGVFTRDRRPKAAAHALRRRWRATRLIRAPARKPAMTEARFAFRQFLGYAAGDAANNLAFSMSSMFLLIYYTDVVGISAAAVGTLFLVVRFWDAFADIFAGRVVDRTSTRWGKFRPFLLFGSLPLLLLSVAVVLRARRAERQRRARLRLRLLRDPRAGLQPGEHPVRLDGHRDDPAAGGARQARHASGSSDRNLTILMLALVVAPQIKGSDDLQRSLTITTLGVRRGRVRALPLHLPDREGAGASATSRRSACARPSTP